MGSVTANWVRMGPGTSNFNPTMTVQGMIYHHIGALLPPEGVGPAFLSVYMYDTDLATQTATRSEHGGDRLRPAILQRLAEELQSVNSYIQSFQQLREWAQSNNGPAEYRMVIHADRRPTTEHARRYNRPESSEVAALIPGPDNGMVGNRDVVVSARGTAVNGSERLRTISWDHRSYDPLAYVLLFPDGRDGWHHELRLRSDDSEPQQQVDEGSGQPEPPHDAEGDEANGEDDIQPGALIAPQLNDSHAQPDNATAIDGPAEPANVPADDAVDDEPTKGAEERENRDEDTRNGRLLKSKVFYSYLLFESEVEENPLLYA